MNIIPVFLLYLLWSSSFPIGKWLLQYSSPIFLTGFRMFFAGGLITLFFLIKDRRFPRLSKAQWGSLALLGFLSIYLSNILEFYGLQSLSAGKTCFIYSLSPFFSAFLSYLHFKEKMTRMKWVGLLIGLIGFIPSLDFSHDFDLKISLPELAVIGAAFSAVYGWILLRAIVKESLSPWIANGYSMVFGGLFALVHSLFFDNWNPIPVLPQHIGSVFSGVLAMTIISNLICYNLYGLLLRRFTATFLSFCGLLSPIFASLNAWILLGETPSMKLFLSTGVVLIGLSIFYRTELKQGYIKTIPA